MTTTPTIDTETLPTADAIRAWFPILSADTVLFENAGGAQVPRSVADGIRDYMLESYVQLEAGYDLSDRADHVVEGAHDFVGRLVNGNETGHVVIGPSTSQLMSMLAGCVRGTLRAGDEIVIMEAGHEANVGPWVKLEEAGATIRWWRVDPETGESPLEALDAVLSDRTRIVAVVHVSNLLGGVLDLKEVSRRAHAVGAQVVVDGVAFAPHRVIDVPAWDVDWYVYSAYKVYGPHQAALGGKREAFTGLTGPNHFFVPADEIPYKFELGGVSHEACAAILGLEPYLHFLAGSDPEGPCDRTTIEAAFAVMTTRELALQQAMIDDLLQRPGVRIVGPHDTGIERVPTISFTHERHASRAISDALQREGFGLRHGHMYAHRLCTAMGIEPEDGVLRASLVHYNTIEEIERFSAALDRVLARVLA